jgi:alkylation response protein AidB-like acyl-CoA dehydrogenase
MQFVLHELVGIDEIAKIPGFEETPELMDSILEEAANFASGVLDPINRIGDTQGCTLHADGSVTTPDGFKEAYKQFADAGWIGLPVPEEYGGQHLPSVLLGPTLEMWNGANIGFANGPLLNQGAIEAFELAATDEIKKLYIPKLVDGSWSGTMCLTEPQAGSDLAAVRTTAVPDGDHFLIKGQKIYITFGEHDMTENIAHLVLARLPGAPEGTKGISMFVVPKFMVNADGSLGDRNDVLCTGIEHKLGINGNPTCTLNYGEKGTGAVGYIIGEPNRGLEYMFVMMNAARFSTGVQGLAIADRAYQSALAYAKERVQFRDVAARSPEAVAIIKHPDVRRMLMTMKCQIEAMRALAYVTSASLDLAAHSTDDAQRKDAKAFVEFMIPVVKGWLTETGQEICSTALQVFGGMGYVEETGIAQQYRDVRITTIYEGTTGIQALDLVGRKLIKDMGTSAGKTMKKVSATAKDLAASSNKDVAALSKPLGEAAKTLSDMAGYVGMSAMSDMRKSFACSVPFLKAVGVVAGGWQLFRGAQIAGEKLAAGSTDPFYTAKIQTATFYAHHILTQVDWLKRQVMEGSADVMTMTEENFELDRAAMAMA